jgi:hypothetical protein
MYKLNGEIHETIMIGQTADIPFICSFAWYDWVYYNKQNAAFTASKMTLGRYLGPTDPEAGSVLSAKITPLEDANTELATAKTNFSNKVNSRLGDPIKDHR